MTFGSYYYFCNIMGKIIKFLWAILWGYSLSWAQGPIKTKEVYQLSGLVVNKRNSEPIPYAHVVIKNTRRGTFANDAGFFSLPVTYGDTILFRSIGFRDAALVFNDYMRSYEGDKKNPYIYVIEYLMEDTITLPSVTIRPFQNAEELKTAILNVPLPSERLDQISQNNLDPTLLKFFMKNLDVDDKERTRAVTQLYQYQYQRQRLVPMAPLDPLTLARLINHLVQESKSKKSKNYDYWPD